jgi:hypothetical protein
MSLAAHALAGAAGIRSARGAANRADWERKYLMWQAANELKTDRVNERTLSVPELCAQIDTYSVPSAINVAEWTGERVGAERLGKAILGSGKVAASALEAAGHAAVSIARAASEIGMPPVDLSNQIGEFVERANDHGSAEAADLRNAYGNLYSTIPEPKRALFSQGNRRTRRTFGRPIHASAIRLMKPTNSRYGSYPGQFYISRVNYARISPDGSVQPRRSALQRARNSVSNFFRVSPQTSPNHNLEAAKAQGEAFRAAEAASSPALPARPTSLSGRILSALQGSPDKKPTAGGKRTRHHRKLKRSSKTRRQ